MTADQPAESRETTIRHEEPIRGISTPLVVPEMSSPPYQPFPASLSSVPNDWNRPLLKNLRDVAKSGNLGQISDALSMFEAYTNAGESRLGMMEPAMKQFVNDLRDKGVNAEWSYGQSDRPGFQFTPTGFDAAAADSAKTGVPYNMKKEVGYLKVGLVSTMSPSPLMAPLPLMMATVGKGL